MIGNWYAVKDGDAMARGLFNRHYSRHFYKDNRRPKLFVGPGEKMVLMTNDGRALFVWRKFQSDDNQEGVNCAIFRNEGERLSSELILEAEQLAWAKWPGERLYTYVAPRKIKSSNPGYCFLKAGWRKCGVTKVNKLVILEKKPPQAEGTDTQLESRRDVILAALRDEPLSLEEATELIDELAEIETKLEQE